jgi:DNA-binding beta-propeller fold protein YncE
MSTKRVLLSALTPVCLLLASSATAQTFITAWGTFGAGDGQFQTPQGVAIGGSGNVYVVDGDNHRISVFTPNGAFLRQWSTVCIPNGGCPQTSSIAVDAYDNVYVGTQGNSTIYKYTSNGALLTQWPATPPAHQGVLSFGLLVDGAGNVYTTIRLLPSGAGLVRIFTESGSYVSEWPAGDPDGLALDSQGNVYVVEKSLDKIWQFTNTGSKLAEWGNTGSGDGQFDAPVRVSVGPSGTVYVVDNGNSRVQAFTPGGQFVAKWGSFGAAPGQFINPIGVAVDANGDIYVADSNNSRIEKFGFAPTPVQSVTWGALKSRYRSERGAEPAAQGR